MQSTYCFTIQLPEVIHPIYSDMEKQKTLSPQSAADLLGLLRARFESNMHRHSGISWNDVVSLLEKNTPALWSLNEMERTGGEPDVTGYDPHTGALLFYDCSKESPAGRRSLCYDSDALEARKENKPANSAMGMASEMGIRLLSEDQYHHLQQFGAVDTKTSSWVLTPETLRKLGGAVFGDYRYGRVFIYHNGAESYYAARGFRGWLSV